MNTIKLSRALLTLGAAIILQGCDQPGVSISTPSVSSIDIPGTIQAEAYESYFDSTIGNSGSDFRLDNVDVYPNQDNSGYHVSQTTTGEYLGFNILVSTSGQYEINARINAPISGRQIQYKLDGQTISNLLLVPTSPQSDEWLNLVTQVSLSSGTHDLQVYFENGDVNLDYLTISIIGSEDDTDTDPVTDPVIDPVIDPVTDPVTDTNTDIEPTLTVTWAINAGGQAVTTQAGLFYQADALYQGGLTGTTEDAIAQTQDDTLYQSERWGQNLMYSLPVSQGSYKVTLHMVELYHMGNELRKQSISIEGTQVESNLDTHAIVGHDSALNLVYDNINVEDGILNLNFSASADAANVAGILVESIQQETGNDSDNTPDNDNADSPDDNTNTDPNSEPDDNSPDTDSAYSRGKETWELNCSNSFCHSAGAVQGVFEAGSLADKGLYSLEQLSGYIQNEMPFGNAASCDESCASDVTSYIGAWHSLPFDNGDTIDDGLPNNPVTTKQCNTQTSMGYQSIRLLTRDQYQHSVEDLLGVNFDITKTLPSDTTSGAFTNNNGLSVLDSTYISYITTAQEVAQWASEQQFSPALQCASFNEACAISLVDDLAWKIFRRPLNNEERLTYLSMAKGDATEGNVKEGIELALAGLLSSPQFIYRHEIGEPAQGMGNGVFQLTPYELAAFISFSFAGTTPDTTLLNAAKNNQLIDDAQIKAQVSRLLDSGASQDLMKELVHDWLNTDSISTQQKDQSLYPNFSTVAPLMRDELSEVFSHVMLNENETYESLYNPDYTFTNSTLAQHYGISGVSGSDFQKTPSNERGGLLLSGAFLSHWAHPDESNAITRAVHVRRDMLCQDIPEPPAGVSLSLNDKEGQLAEFLDLPTTTQRMRFHRLTETGSCSSCHAEIINPLGFGLEDYDTVGIRRDEDLQGNTINANGALWSPFLELQFFDDPNRIQHKTEFTGGKQLAELMASDPTISNLAKSCLASQMLSYTTGIDSRSINQSHRVDVLSLSMSEKDSYNCDVTDLVNTLFNQSPREMLETLGTLESVRYRKAWTR
jgi:hypothetical protein